MTREPTYIDASPSPVSLAIVPAEVARLANAGPPDRCAQQLDAAIAEARTLLSPEARWVAVEPNALGALFAGPTPVADVAAAGRAFAFAATIGPALEVRVREHLETTRFLEGLLLDAAGSAAVEAVADQIEGRCAEAAGCASTRFSPGYCSWSLASQLGLFAALAPQQLGITLLESFLMQPLKSVSGLVVCGDAADLVIPKDACSDCDARGCSRRRGGPPIPTQHSGPVANGPQPS